MRKRRESTLVARSVLVAWGLVALAAWPGTSALPGAEAEKEAKEEDPEADEGSKGTDSTKPVDPDEKLVREKLQEAFSPTKIEFLDDGKVHLIFNFGERKEEHMKIFTPNISEKAQSSFRWALDGEFILDSWGRLSDDEPGVGTSEGIRVGNAGVAHLNLWLKNDVEAEVAYVQCVSSSPKQIVAVVFTNAKGQSLASNFGSQCALFSGGRLRQRVGAYESVRNEAETRLKLALDPEKFTASRDNKKRSELKYRAKDFESGKIGFLWAGGIAGFVHRLEITGTIDYEKTAEDLRKEERRRR